MAQSALPAGRRSTKTVATARPISARKVAIFLVASSAPSYLAAAYSQAATRPPSLQGRRNNLSPVLRIRA